MKLFYHIIRVAVVPISQCITCAFSRTSKESFISTFCFLTWNLKAKTQIDFRKLHDITHTQYFWQKISVCLTYNRYGLQGVTRK